MMSSMVRAAATREQQTPTPTINTQTAPRATEVEVQPHEQLQVLLGKFTAETIPVGYSIEITPDPDADSVVAQIVRFEHELVLHINNYSNATVTAAICQL